MSLIPAGLTNANAFYSQHYLDDILERDLKALFDRWKEQAGQSPAARLRGPPAVPPTSAPGSAFSPSVRPPSARPCSSTWSSRCWSRWAIS